MRAYLLICGAIFIAGSLYRIGRVLLMPTHLRWDLYPMPRGTRGQRRYGGSYFENSEWWRTRARRSRAAELRYVAGEALALRTLWQRNRPLWLWSWLMHVGLYSLVASAVLTAWAAISDSPWAEVVRWTAIFGGAAGIAGSLGLLVARILQRTPFSGRRDYFNLAAILCVCVTAMEAFSFAAAPGEMIAFSRSLFSSAPAPQVAPALALHLAIVGAFLAYFPATHMTHAFMKFFAFHRVGWDDAAMAHDPHLSAAIAHNFGRTLSWSAPHIRGGETWGHACAPGAEGRG